MANRNINGISALDWVKSESLYPKKITLKENNNNVEEKESFLPTSNYEQRIKALENNQEIILSLIEKLTSQQIENQVKNKE